MPTPTPAPLRVQDVVLDSTDTLKVLDVKTASQALPALGNKACSVIKDNGPRHAPDLDCADFIKKSIKDSGGFDGILAQNFSFNAFNGFPWTAACRPTLVRVQIRADQLAKTSDGIGLYLKGTDVRIAPPRVVSRDEILKN